MSSVAIVVFINLLDNMPYEGFMQRVLIRHANTLRF
jgi:hypothetical protein